MIMGSHRILAVQHLPFRHLSLHSDQRLVPERSFNLNVLPPCALCEAVLPRAVREQPASTATLPTFSATL